jgi:histidyl-tRNA synthetase
LLKLGFNDFQIRINHRDALTGVLDAVGVARELHGGALVTLDKLDKIGRDGVVRELRDRGITNGSAAALTTVFDRVPAGLANAESNTIWLEALRAVPQNAALAAAIEQLAAVLGLGASTSAGPYLRLDPSLARGLSYYTGTIMEINVADLPGSLAGGGRYDNLIGMFLGEEVPACGFSLGLERILVVMTDRGMFPASVAGAPADVLVTLWSAERTADALRLAGRLRQAGLRVDVYSEVDKLGKQFKYASSRGIPWVLVLGDDEAARGEIAVKNMSTGEQRSVAEPELAVLFGRH